MSYNRSICSTCRFLNDCVLTTNKGNINSCSEYIHIFEEEQEAFIFHLAETPKRKPTIKSRRSEMVSF